MVELREIERGYNKNVVRCLKLLLEKAKEGEILSICFIAERVGGIFTFYTTPSDDRFRQLGAATRLVHELHTVVDDSWSETDLIVGVEEDESEV